MIDGRVTDLKTAAALRGFQGDGSSPSVLLLVPPRTARGMHSTARTISAAMIAGISDVLLGIRNQTIQDCEDSVAAVDADDKVQAYRKLARTDDATWRPRLEKG